MSHNTNRVLVVRCSLKNADLDHSSFAFIIVSLVILLKWTRCSHSYQADGEFGYYEFSHQVSSDETLLDKLELDSSLQEAHKGLKK